MGERIFITGCAGYLASSLIEKCLGDKDVEWIGGNDIRKPGIVGARFNFYELDVRDERLSYILKENNVNTLVHLAWIFNPTHSKELEYEVDVKGSENVLRSCKEAGVKYILYLSSTTAYGVRPDNPPEMEEEYPRRGHDKFLYSKHKAIVDDMFMRFIKENPDINVCVYRAPIVLGPNTKNFLVSFVKMPVMFAVRGYDPFMQFIHEEDMRELLYWSIKNKPVGVYNVAGSGLVRYSDIAKIFNKRRVKLPEWLIYPITEILWRMRILDFPSAVLDFIKYPWVCKTIKFKETYPEFEIRYSSEDAVKAFAEGYRRK